MEFTSFARRLLDYANGVYEGMDLQDLSYCRLVCRMYYYADTRKPMHQPEVLVHQSERPNFVHVCFLI